MINYYVLNHNNKTCCYVGSGDWDLLKNEILTMDKVYKIFDKNGAQKDFIDANIDVFYDILMKFTNEDGTLNIVDEKTRMSYFNNYINVLIEPRKLCKK